MVVASYFKNTHTPMLSTKTKELISLLIELTKQKSITWESDFGDVYKCRSGEFYVTIRPTEMPVGINSLVAGFQFLATTSNEIIINQSRQKPSSFSFFPATEKEKLTEQERYDECILLEILYNFAKFSFNDSLRVVSDSDSLVSKLIGNLEKKKK